MIIPKAILATFIIALFSSSSLFAQFDISKSLFSDDQRFVRQAIDSALVIVRQDYVLKSTTGLDSTEWGRSGNSWFGRGYTLGIKAGDFVWANSRINTPWTGDQNLKKYEKADTLKPLLSSTSIRPIYSREYLYAKRSDEDSLLAAFSLHKPIAGLALGNMHGEQQGWVVLAYTVKPISVNDTSTIELSIFKTIVTFNDSIADALLNKVPEKENIVGGVFVTTNITTGNIQLLVSGILIKKLLNWYIRPIVPTMKPILEQEIRLTPIPANKSNKTE
jgi:hypothetical protein